MEKKNRIWELDALRGIFIFLVVVIHFVFDLQYFVLKRSFAIPVFDFIWANTGEVFILLSGLCATLGHRTFRRGATVFACGMLITAVTVGMYLLQLAAKNIIIYFGVLHLLGFCMMVYPLFRKLPTAVIGVIGAVLAALGLWFATLRVASPYLFPLGLTSPSFSSSDYFPILPHLGWFLLGSVIGRTAYRQRRTLLPKFPADCAVIRFFRFCGRHSLWIYMAHQPLLYGIVLLIA